MGRIPRGASRTCCCCPGLAGCCCSTSTRRSSCSSSRSGPGTSTEATSRRGTSGSTPKAFKEYWPWIVRSAAYGGLATILAFLLGYPLAYTIAFRAALTRTSCCSSSSRRSSRASCSGRSRGRSSWPTTASCSGRSRTSGPARRLPDPGDARSPSIAGITYNLLPFMTLPLYVAIEKVDFRLLEAAKDLYAGPWRPGGTIVGGIARRACSALFVGARPRRRSRGAGGPSAWRSRRHRRDVPDQPRRSSGSPFPLSLPGVFAGSLLTFIPAVGDFVNAELLGNPQAQMIGNVIQARFLQDHRLPDGVGAVVHPHGRDHRRRARVCTGPRDRGADGGAGHDRDRRRRPARPRTTPAPARLGRAVDRWLLPLYTLGVVVAT